MNVWMHPPREFLFKILQLNPFPFIQGPYKLGTTWEGKLVVGDHWSDSRWKYFTGSVEIQFEYEILEPETIKIDSFGDINCIVVYATGSSSLGKSYLKSWFHTSEGFIRLEYTNIDGSKIVLNREFNV